MRPRGVRDLRHEAAYLFGASCPERDTGVALVLPAVSAAAMQATLAELGAAISPGAHAILLMDRAGWHTARELDLPGNLTPLFLPAYSPELNAIERVWLDLRERFLSHRLWPTYDHTLDACCAAWNTLSETGRIRSLCALDWAGMTWSDPILVTDDTDPLLFNDPAALQRQGVDHRRSYRCRLRLRCLGSPGAVE